MSKSKASLRRILIRTPDGKTATMWDCVKKATNEELHKEINDLIDTIKTRVEKTDDRNTLVDLYALFLGLNLGKKTTINVPGQATSEEKGE